MQILQENIFLKTPFSTKDRKHHINFIENRPDCINNQKQIKGKFNCTKFFVQIF